MTWAPETPEPPLSEIVPRMRPVLVWAKSVWQRTVKTNAARNRVSVLAKFCLRAPRMLVVRYLTASDDLLFVVGQLYHHEKRTVKQEVCRSSPDGD
jgi:capsular polysaccharide biosynthesis protein